MSSTNIVQNDGLQKQQDPLHEPVEGKPEHESHEQSVHNGETSQKNIDMNEEDQPPPDKSQVKTFIKHKKKN